MRSGVVKGCCGALAAAVLVATTAGLAQARGGPGGEGGGRHYGGRGYGHSRHGSHGHSHSRSSFGLWVGPGWGSWGWGGTWGWGGAWGYPAPYYRPYYRAYPYSYPYYSYPYRYYAPPVVVEPPVVSQPSVVAPRPVPEAPAPGQGGESAWYYCPDPEGYYPYVRDCPAGWKQVSPTPEGAGTPPTEPATGGGTPMAAEPAPGGAAYPDRGGPVPREYQWYHCADPEGYYPYVRDCPAGWKQVSPAPPR